MPHKKPHEKYKQAASMEQNDMFVPVEEPEIEEAAPDIPKNLDALCQEYICPTCPEKEAAEQVRLRALAEMDNFKKRLTREHEEQMRYAAEKVLADLLPTLDNLDLALQYGTQSEACKDILTGVAMTRKLLLDAVKKHGLEPVGATGDAFTPELHEALSFEDRDDLDEGCVSTVMQRGYKLKDRLLRPAKVSICRKPAE